MRGSKWTLLNRCQILLQTGYSIYPVIRKLIYAMLDQQHQLLKRVCELMLKLPFFLHEQHIDCLILSESEVCANLINEVIWKKSAYFWLTQYVYLKLISRGKAQLKLFYIYRNIFFQMLRDLLPNQRIHIWTRNIFLLLTLNCAMYNHVEIKLFVDEIN